MKYRTCALVDAFKWTGDQDQIEYPEWAVELVKSGAIEFDDAGSPRVHLHVSLPGRNGLIVRPGEYLVRDKYGHVFHRTEAELNEQFEAIDEA